MIPDDLKIKLDAKHALFFGDINSRSERLISGLIEPGIKVSCLSPGIEEISSITKKLIETNPDLILLYIGSEKDLQYLSFYRDNNQTDLPHTIFIENSFISQINSDLLRNPLITIIDASSTMEEVLFAINSGLDKFQLWNTVRSGSAELERLRHDKNELLSIAAHDLKNPIYSISMLAKVIKNEKSLTIEEVNEFSQDILITAQRMLELIGDLLDLNKIEQGDIVINPENVDINEICSTITNLYADKAGVKNLVVTYETDNTDLVINIDRRALFQILDNLLSNAIKYSPFNRTIVLRTRSNDKTLRIEVEDEGPGISSEEMGRLFGKFSKLSSKPTGDEDSTGLGLSIVKKYTELLGGKVWCESEINKGSVFIVEFPL